MKEKKTDPEFAVNQEKYNQSLYLKHFLMTVWVQQKYQDDLCELYSIDNLKSQFLKDFSQGR